MNAGLLDGTQLHAPISAPLNVTGHSIDAAAKGDCVAPISVSINVCGTSLAKVLPPPPGGPHLLDQLIR
jgi:hypothetical protein